MVEINVGIVADGPTDYKIFGRIIESICRQDEAKKINIVPLIRHQIHDHVQRYKRNAGQKGESEYYLPSETAKHLLGEVLGTVNNAFDSFCHEVEISSQSLLLITTDTEHSLSQKNQYFGTWAWSVSYILAQSIDKFYDFKIGQGYSRQDLPTVMSLATFPSTEVLIAAARGILDKHYGKKPDELKYILYQTTHPREEDLEREALQHITSENIDLIFKNAPETRILLKNLSFSCHAAFFCDSV